MERLMLILIGDTDVVSMCLQEAVAAGHEVKVIVSDQKNLGANNSLVDAKQVICLDKALDARLFDCKNTVYVFCSAHYHQLISAPKGRCLSFNEQIFKQKNKANSDCTIWYLTADDGFFYPTTCQISSLDTLEEIIRDSFIEIISSISRGSLCIKSITSEYEMSQCILPYANLYEGFMQTVQNNPDAIALIYDDDYLSYRQLSELVIKVSAVLEPYSNHIVALYFTRGINMIIGLLATLRINAAYLPLDPKNPHSRNQFILQDSQSQVLLYEENTAERAYALECSIQRISINWKQPTFQAPILSNTELQNRTNPIAYIIYTSGSTGKPKGVLCTHKGALNMILWTIKTYPIQNEDKVIQLASYAFDISVWEIFAALLSGGSLVLASDDAYSDPFCIKELITKHQITVAHMIPGILNLFLNQLEHQQIKSLRHIVSGGEELRPLIADMFFQYLPTCNLYHGYGPTECAITSIHHLVKPGTYHDFISIGLPIQNTSLYIVDEYLRVQSHCNEGEGLIAGAGLAHGYINNPTETKKRFIKKGHFYKTGDRLKKLADGTIQYLGRIDQQLKIRGNRVELEEIERAIMNFPEINDCSVQPIYELDTLLIAYCVFKILNDKSMDNLKAFLNDRLPSYMVPIQFVVLTVLPRTVNGKINAQHLRDSYYQSLNHNQELLNDDSPTELSLISFIRHELKLPVEDVESNLISLGVSSLTIIHLINYIEKTYAIKIKPAEVFTLQSIRKIAELIHSRVAEDRWLIGQEIAQVDRHNTLKLSHSQARLWFLHQLEAQQSSAYNIFNVYILDGFINLSKLARAFTLITSRHEVLRTRFLSVNGRAHQVIDPHVPISLKPQKIEPQELLETIRQMGTYHFKLEKEHAFKIRVYELSSTQYALCILQHNIITDGWSGGILLNELNHYYNNFSASELPPVIVQYADYAAWQNRRITSNLIEKELVYWQQKLHQYTPLDMPLDFPRKTRQTFKGALEKISIPSNELKNIQAYSNHASVTLNMYLLTVLNVLLARYTDQTDILIGTGYSGRDKEALKNTMGFFVNTLPLRSSFSEQDSFFQALKTCKTTLLEALSHSEIPFDVIVDKLKIEREPNLSPLFQILFLMQDAADSIHLSLDNLVVKPLDFDLGISIYDITFNVNVNNEGLHIVAQYNTDLFTSSTIIHFLSHYKTAISYFAEHDHEKIYFTNMLNQSDKDIIKQFNTIPYLDKPQTSLINWFNHVVDQYSNQLALCELSNESITYQKLNQYSLVFAAHLYQKYGTDKILGIYMDKSIAFFVTLLAIIKSGNTYLILDTEMPAQRIEYIIKDCAALAVVIDDKQLPSLITPVKIEHYFQRELIGDLSLLCLPARPADMCYILYTSGSTGVPKGVMISHANLLNTLGYFLQKLSPLPQKTSVLSLTNTSFDIFQLEVFLPLLSGGVCYFYNQSLTYCQEYLTADLPQLSINVIQATPSAWKLILEKIRVPMQHVVALVGGEALSTDLLNSLQQQFKQVFNVYGPTETTIWSSMADLSASETIHLGKPIANTYFLVVDSRNQIVPVGCVGELLIAGNSVCMGYQGNRLENQSQFIQLTKPDFFQNTRRFYKTGDKVKLNHDALMIYHGRVNNQVKLRGYRIELDEIAIIVKQYEGILDAVVALLQVDERQKEPIVVCFVIEKHAITINKLIQHCRDVLPTYMIPSVFIPLKNIPLNNNGKTDYFQLAAVYKRFISDSIDDQVAMSPTENSIATIWREHLGVEGIDRLTSFFYLGGSSLLIAEIIAKTNTLFNTKLTIRDFVEHPTVAAQATIIISALSHISQPNHQFERS